MAPKKKNIKLKSLSHGRPPTAKKPQSISSKATRTLIRTHHTLQKRRAKALAEGDETGAAAIAREIELQGGLETYQRASLTGQRNERGGDSSKILMDWLSPALSNMRELSTNGLSLKMLEVGALSTGNACSRSRLFGMERIDLNSQSEGIKQQDFMERPLPRDETETFDIISLSLVLNYVPDAVGKGEMLRRTLKFLKPATSMQNPELAEFFPSLFLVLPAPCVNNSRYMDEARLESIMRSLEYELVKKKISNKLLYHLWRRVAGAGPAKVLFKKEEIRTGKDRNNFAIVLK
ncbi:25S rRNA adenine-N(1) methyltransferase [Coleophoma cylindrospora]|uniref:25S rRNA adenine-N(1) methyltransferase n=1 Tax=Coleophoma cylindrospora TaxID=1849047 RepID=A0A3D8STN2_9HELO|nr:25S rRNA adenine-N(1) methyltransferase [Coleophoma cylindrospora]